MNTKILILINSLLCIKQMVKAGLSPPKKSCFICFNERFKNDEKCFIFHVKSPFYLKIFNFFT